MTLGGLGELIKTDADVEILNLKARIILKNPKFNPGTINSMDNVLTAANAEGELSLDPA